MKIGIKEKSTIEALNKISEYPYAASLLTYAIIERILKEYIIKHRKNRVLLHYFYQKPSKKQISLANYHNQRKQDFIKKFIKKISLGDAQNIVMANNKRDYATARNKLMHSNLFLLEERKYNKKERQLINKNNFEIAIDHLKFVINNFADFMVDVKDGKMNILK